MARSYSNNFVFENINEQELLDICESASKEFDNFTKEGLQLVKQIENCANQMESLIKADKIAP